MGIWQQTRKMNSVIAVHRIFSCDSRAAKGGQCAHRRYNSAASLPGQRHRLGGQAHLERDLTVGLRHLRQHVQHGLDQRQEADVAHHLGTCRGEGSEVAWDELVDRQEKKQNGRKDGT